MIIYGGKKEATNAVMGKNLAAAMNAIVGKAEKNDETKTDETVKAEETKKKTTKKK